MDRFLSMYFQRKFIKGIGCKACGVKGRMSPYRTVDGARLFCKECSNVQRVVTRNRRCWKWNESREADV